MTIKRNTDGMADFWIDQMEDISQRDDLDIEKKIKLAKSCSQEVREYVKANLAYKQLMMRAPDVAKNASIVLSIGSPEVKKVEDKQQQA